MQEAIDAISHDRTTIVIAHRLSTVKNADKIIVMSFGEIAESGTHQELIAQKGIYAELVEAQTLRGVEGEQPENNLSRTKTISDSGSNSLDIPTSGINVLKIDDGDETNVKVDKKDNVDLMRILMYNKPEFGWMSIGALAAMTNGVSQPLFAIIFSDVLTILGESGANDLALLFVYLAIGAFVANFLQISLFQYSSEKMTRRVREVGNE